MSVGTEGGETSQSEASGGGSGFTEVQLATIGEVMQGLLDKALSREHPSVGDGGGPSQG